MNSFSLAPRRWLFATTLLLLAGALQVIAAPLPRATPESQGVSSAGVLQVVDTLDKEIKEMHSLMILRHGQVVAEGWWAPYGPEYNHVLFSLSKSFTSTAVGLAVAEGKLSINDVVFKFFPEDAPEKPSKNLAAMRVRDLLTMSTGHQDEPPRSPAEMTPKSFLAQEVAHKPGTHFKYNTPATFMQSAIVQKVTGKTVLDYLRPRLFEPLGIEHPVWDTNCQGISLGGYGLRVRTEDIAKFGQLYLQKGQWQGRQLIPANWIELATSRQVSNGSNPDSDWDQGYGFQFWRCRHGAFRGDGAFGQFCLVLPEQDVVIAITSGGNNLQGILNILWDKLLPALKTSALPADGAASSQLKTKLAALSLRPVPGNASSPVAAKLLGKTISLAENPLKIEAITLTPGKEADQITLVLKQGGKDVVIPCGFRQWVRGKGLVEAGNLFPAVGEPIASRYAWTSDDTISFKICAFETPFVNTISIKITDAAVAAEFKQNVTFGSNKPLKVAGQIK